MIKKTAQAGTLESSDCLVIVSPAEGFSMEYKGLNKSIFESRTLKITKEISERLSPEGALVRIQDQGALEMTLRARIETAFERALNQVKL